MPAVIPSQIVFLIDQAFPGARVTPKFPIYSGHAAILSAIVRLTKEIPDELIAISGEDYIDLVHASESLANSVAHWNQQGGDDPPKYIKDKSPVAIVREMLAKCPDQRPALGTADLSFITDVAPRESIRLDLSTATSALHNGEWKASTVLAGSVVEALLLWAIQSNSGSVAALTSKPASAPENWMLNELIDVSLSLNLIEQHTATQARLEKDFRNLIHPGRAQRLQQVCDLGTAFTALAAADLTVRDLTP
jgi:hypothetical protein